MDITLQQLRAFAAVARHAHFGRAAAELHVSTSSISENVAGLERRIGERLFVRGPRETTLTPTGRELLGYADRVLEDLDRLTQWARGTRRTPRVRVGITVTTARFRTVMERAARDLDDVEWQIRTLGFEEWPEAFERDEVDVVFVPGVGPPRVPGIEATPLWSEGCVVVMRDDHPLAARDAVGVDDLIGQTVIALTDPTGTHGWLRALTGRVDELTLRPVAHTFEEVLELCGAGLGVNVAGASAGESYARPGLAFVPLTGVPDVTTYLCRPRGRTSPAVAAFAGIARG